MTDPIVDLALRTASTPLVGLDLDRHLSEVCAALTHAAQVAAALVVVLDPAGIHGSDEAAILIGTAQRGAAVGPVANALRSGRPMLTPDLSRVGPPALAAAAADCGLVSSGVLPLRDATGPVGALQLLSGPGWTISKGHLVQLAPLTGVLAAQLANVAALLRASSPAPVIDPPEWGNGEHQNRHAGR